MSFNGDTTFLSGQLRVAALSIALLDFLQVVPREVRLIKSKEKTKTALFVLVRYLGAFALICNAILYFRPTTQEQCNRVHFLGPVSQFIAGAVVQATFFYQTLVTSERSRNVMGIMGFLMILVPVEGLSSILFRQPYLYSNDTTGAYGCASIVPEHKFNANPIFYLARLGFDIFAIVLSSYHVWLKKECCNKRSLITQVYNSGAGFMLADCVANLLTFLASLGVTRIESIGSMFAIMTAMCMAEHMLLLESHNAKTVPPIEEKHQILPSSQSIHSTPGTPGAPGFGPIQRAQTMPSSHRAQSSYDAGLHCARGRDALKYRAEGDTEMFYRVPTRSAQSSTSNLIAPSRSMAESTSAHSSATGAMVLGEAV